MKIAWSPLAMDRASEIVDYIALDKPLAAKKWLDTVLSKIENLTHSPEMGRIVPEIGKSQFREIIHRNYRIVYRLETKTIYILTIRHARQLLPMKEILS